MPTFLATFLTSRWILLVSCLIEYRSTFLTIQCYPELQGKPFRPCVHLPCLTYIPFLVGWQSLTCIWHHQPYNLITTLKVSSASLDLFRWGHSYHTLATPFFDYPSLATPELLLQLLTHLVVILTPTSKTLWTLIKLFPVKPRLRYSDSSFDFSHKR